MDMEKQALVWLCCQMNDFKTMRNGAVVKQLLRYAVVGVTSNVTGYLVYLLVTHLGMEPKVAMSFLYALGATIGYFGNSSFTFSYKGGFLESGIRYGMAHSLGYVLNLALLLVFVDIFEYPHQLVQAIAVFIVAAFLFVAFKFFVFRTTNVEVIREKI